MGMTVAPKQCTSSHDPIRQAVSDQQKHYILLIHLILPHATFFLFPTVKSCLKGTYFASVEEGSNKNGESPEGPSKNLLLGLLPAMTAPNAEEKKEETGEEKKKSREREEPALDGEKGLVRDWSGKTMNAGGVEK
ncbi:hypothetical protein TNCV_5104591 [Trichonephila clavipes]|nr:hypothetical protein TNCV_5104591 [Trichonephila clavipes]